MQKRIRPTLFSTIQKNDNKIYVDLMIIFLKTSQRIFIAKRFDSFNFKEESIIPDGWNTIDIMPVIS